MSVTAKFACSGYTSLGDSIYLKIKVALPHCIMHYALRQHIIT